MALEVFTEEWAAACCARIDGHAGFREAGAEWADAVVLVMLADPARGVAQDRAFHLDLHRGRCRGARPATAADLETTPYVLTASPSAWEQILGGSLEPVAALMTGRLRLARGGLFALAKHAGAARELVRAAGEVPAVFPGAA
ncbi:MAG: putative sterol carrier protein [Gemmatimonadetes bacterium]|nr:putative sterol carrier protein [Gemmatimonadota bacterium]